MLHGKVIGIIQSGRIRFWFFLQSRIRIKFFKTIKSGTGYSDPLNLMPQPQLFLGIIRTPLIYDLSIKLLSNIVLKLFLGTELLNKSFLHSLTHSVTKSFTHSLCLSVYESVCPSVTVNSLAFNPKIKLLTSLSLLLFLPISLFLSILPLFYWL